MKASRLPLMEAKESVALFHSMDDIWNPLHFPYLEESDTLGLLDERGEYLLAKMRL